MAIGVIGLGNIGRGIATNLVADGNDVVVHDVDAAAMAAIAGATAAPDVAAVAKAADVALLSLPTPDVVAEVATAWAAAAAPGAVLVDLSTNSPAVVRQLGEKLAGSGHHLVEAPLTGGAIGAEKRMLVFMVGGADEAVARVVPVLEPLGRATFHVGPLGLGNTMKLLNSLIAFTTTWVSLEGLAMATKAGIALPKAVEILRTAGRVQLLHRPPGRDHRRAQPAHAVRTGAGGQGRRSHRRDRERGGCAHTGRRGDQGRARHRGGRGPGRCRLERARHLRRAASRRGTALERRIAIGPGETTRRRANRPPAVVPQCVVGSVPAFTSGAQMVVPPCRATNLPSLTPISKKQLLLAG